MQKSTLIFIFLLLTVCTYAQQYPHPDSTYRKEQIISFLQDYQHKSDIRGLAYTYFAYARNQEKWGDLQESPIDNFRKSMDYFQILGDSINFYEVRGNLGIYFMDKPVFKRYAKEYIRGAVRYFQQTYNAAYEINHLINLANDYVHQYSLDTARLLLNRADLLNKQINNIINQGRINAAWSDFYRHKQNYDLTIVYAQRSLATAKSSHILWLEALSLYYIACSLHSQGNIKKALEILAQCRKATEQNSAMVGLREVTYREYSQIYVEKKDFQQAHYFAELATNTAKQSYYSKLESEIRSFPEYQLVEEHKIQLNKIALDRKLADAELESLRSRQKIYILLIFIACLLMGVLVYIYLARQRLNSLQKEKVQKSLEIKTLNALISGQELERFRIARELHDGVGTLLSRLKILTGSKSISLEKVQTMLDEACEEVRNISGNLQPNALETFGLIRSIDDLVVKQHSENPRIIFQYFGNEFPIATEKNLMIYRIVQELLTNALKYAQAHKILIQINYEEPNLTLTVEDDGIGFDPSLIDAKSSGWRNIQSRINYLQGNLTLQTDAQSGTSVMIEICF